VGARYVSSMNLHLDYLAHNDQRKPADLAILKSLADDATSVEREMVEVFSQKDDYIRDFDFTPIHIAVLGLYDVEDGERPSLTR
jgi:Uri superfamily endonuclease